MKRAFLQFLRPLARTAVRSGAGRFPLVKSVYHSCLRPFLPNVALLSLRIEDIEMQLQVPSHDAAFSELHFARVHEEQVSSKLRSIINEGMKVRKG